VGFYSSKWCLENRCSDCGRKIRLVVCGCVFFLLAGLVSAQEPTPTPTPSDSDQLGVIVAQISTTNEFLIFAIGMLIAFIATDKVRP